MGNVICDDEYVVSEEEAEKLTYVKLKSDKGPSSTNPGREYVNNKLNIYPIYANTERVLIPVFCGDKFVAYINLKKEYLEPMIQSLIASSPGEK